MKANENENKTATPTPTPAPVENPAPETAKDSIVATIAALEVERSNFGTQDWAAILFATLVRRGLIPADKFADALVFWGDYPKNPSAFRQTYLETADPDGPKLTPREALAVKYKIAAVLPTVETPAA